MPDLLERVYANAYQTQRSTLIESNAKALGNFCRKGAYYCWISSNSLFVQDQENISTFIQHNLTCPHRAETSSRTSQSKATASVTEYDGPQSRNEHSKQHRFLNPVLPHQQLEPHRQTNPSRRVDAILKIFPMPQTKNLYRKWRL